MAAPLQVQVIARGSATPLVRAAGKLRAALAADGRLDASAEVLAAGARAEDDDVHLARANALVASARDDYTNLDPAAALDKLTRARKLLRVLLARSGAVAQLAGALRVEGLTLLYVDRATEAAQSFASAYFLDPEFAPGADRWPPEARLAYADAVAAARADTTGSLSLSLEPAVARVWVDGREVGLGSTTVEDLGRGEHHVLVTCPGHTPFAAVVAIQGDGRLDQASVFLEAGAGVRDQAVSAFSAAFDSDDEAVVARQAAALLKADALVLVSDEAARRRTLAWILDDTGSRRGAAVALDDLGAVARDIATRLAGETEAVEPPDPWYLRWYSLAAAGVVVVGGAVALALALAPDGPDRVSFHLGDPP